MPKIAQPNEVRSYWLNMRSKDWFIQSDDVDADITRRFLATWERARDGNCEAWLQTPDDLFSYIILCDQLPRNMFRGSGAAFATDAFGRAATSKAIEAGWDMQIPEPERQFVYMPLMHSEVLADQELAIEMFDTRMPKTGEENRLHSLAHRNVIAEFGRFPYRNAALGRTTTPPEQRFLDAGGYGHALRHVQAVEK